MSARGEAGEWLFTTRWVHVYEEDTAGGAVYRPEGDAIPLSRRPREQIELDRDGSARLYVAGPDDRPAPQAATWQDDDAPAAGGRGGGSRLVIVDRSATRLVVRVASAGQAR